MGSRSEAAGAVAPAGGPISAPQARKNFEVISYILMKMSRKTWLQVGLQPDHSSALSRMASRVVGIGSFCHLLLLLQRLFSPACQQHCSHQFGSHDGPKAAGSMLQSGLTHVHDALANLHGVTCTSVQPSAAERRLMVTGPSGWWGPGRSIPCLFDRCRCWSAEHFYTTFCVRHCNTFESR